MKPKGQRIWGGQMARAIRRLAILAFLVVLVIYLPRPWGYVVGFVVFILPWLPFVVIEFFASSIKPTTWQFPMTEEIELFYDPVTRVSGFRAWRFYIAREPLRDLLFESRSKSDCYFDIRIGSVGIWLFRPIRHLEEVEKETVRTRGIPELVAAVEHGEVAVPLGMSMASEPPAIQRLFLDEMAKGATPSQAALLARRLAAEQDRTKSTDADV